MYINLTTGAYPLTEQAVRADFPNTSFPSVFPCPDGYAVVFPAPPPEYDPMTQFAREVAPELTVKGHYEQRYEIIDLDAETIAANEARAVEANKQRVLAEILVLQNKCLRCLVEDVPDTTWLDTYKAQIAALRAQL